MSKQNKNVLLLTMHILYITIFQFNIGIIKCKMYDIEKYNVADPTYLDRD